MADCAENGCLYWCTGTYWFLLSDECDEDCVCTEPALPCSPVDNPNAHVLFPCTPSVAPPPTACSGVQSLWRCVDDGVWELVDYTGNADCLPTPPIMPCFTLGVLVAGGAVPAPVSTGTLDNVTSSSSSRSSSSSSSTGCGGACPEPQWRHTATLTPASLAAPHVPTTVCGGRCDIPGLPDGAADAYTLTVPLPGLAAYAPLVGDWTLTYQGVVGGYPQWKSVGTSYWKLSYVTDTQQWNLTGVLAGGDTVSFLTIEPFEVCGYSSLEYETHTAAGPWGYPKAVATTPIGPCQCCDGGSSSSSSSGGDAGSDTTPCRGKLAGLLKTDRITFQVSDGTNVCANITSDLIGGYRPDPTIPVWLGTKTVQTAAGAATPRFLFVDDDGDPIVLFTTPGVGSGAAVSKALTWIGCTGDCLKFAIRPEPWCDSYPLTTCAQCPAGSPRRYTVVLTGLTGTKAAFNGTWRPLYGSGCTWAVTSGTVTVQVVWTLPSAGNRQLKIIFDDTATSAHVEYLGTTEALAGKDGCSGLDVSIGSEAAVPTVTTLGPCVTPLCGDNTAVVTVCCAGGSSCDILTGGPGQLCLTIPAAAMNDSLTNPYYGTVQSQYPPTGCSDTFVALFANYGTLNPFGDDATYCGYSGKIPSVASPSTEAILVPCASHNVQKRLAVIIVYDRTGRAGLGIGWIAGYDVGSGWVWAAATVVGANTADLKFTFPIVTFPWGATSVARNTYYSGVAVDAAVCTNNLSTTPIYACDQTTGACDEANPTDPLFIYDMAYPGDSSCNGGACVAWSWYCLTATTLTDIDAIPGNPTPCDPAYSSINIGSKMVIFGPPGQTSFTYHTAGSFGGTCLTVWTVSGEFSTSSAALTACGF